MYLDNVRLKSSKETELEDVGGMIRRIWMLIALTQENKVYWCLKMNLLLKNNNNLVTPTS